MVYTLINIFLGSNIESIGADKQIPGGKELENLPGEKSSPGALLE